MKNDSLKTKELNDTVWCKLGVSKIEGIGVIAIRDIPKGTELHCKGDNNLYEVHYKDFHKIRQEIRDIILARHPRARDGEPFLSPNGDARMISFMNHSDNPNYDKWNDIALRDIKKDEEILEDYGEFAKFL